MYFIFYKYVYFNVFCQRILFIIKYAAVKSMDVLKVPTRNTFHSFLDEFILFLPRDARIVLARYCYRKSSVRLYRCGIVSI